MIRLLSLLLVLAATTAAHAMSYKITSLYHLPHGHSVAICLPEIWKYMIKHINNCVDTRGSEYLNRIFHDIANTMGCQSPMQAIDLFAQILTKLEMDKPAMPCSEGDLDILCKSVNVVRLKNNPINLDSLAIKNLYKRIINWHDLSENLFI